MCQYLSGALRSIRKLFVFFFIFIIYLNCFFFFVFLYYCYFFFFLAYNKLLSWWHVFMFNLTRFFLLFWRLIYYYLLFVRWEWWNNIFANKFILLALYVKYDIKAKENEKQKMSNLTELWLTKTEKTFLFLLSKFLFIILEMWDALVEHIISPSRDIISLAALDIFSEEPRN